MILLCSLLFYAPLYIYIHVHTSTYHVHGSSSKGNAGQQLTDNPNLYISRDGGVTWEETLAGSWGVNVADHGGLMVAARDYHYTPSNEVMYSCDEGYSWTTFTFSNVRMREGGSAV